MRTVYRLILLLFCAGLICSPAEAAWWKGNLHTHTFWSDGDDFPEMVAEWYKKNGYHFLALSDHNILLQGEKWIDYRTNATFKEALEKYQARHGSWVITRERTGKQQVRLRTLEEFRGKFEQKGRFLMIPSEEISASYEKLPIHVNATNLREFIEPRGGRSVYEVMQNNIDAVLAQRLRTGQPMFPHLNHPNFHYAVKAEELMRVKGERFFEVYNGHPQVHNEGDKEHPSTDAIWDIVLAWRIGVLGLEPMFGIAVDDSHNYHKMAPQSSNSGRGWVMVNAGRLTPESLIEAMEAGDFYATSGVELKKISRKGKRLSVEVKAEPGVEYTIQFIGTTKDAVTSSADGKSQIDKALIGKILREEKASKARYDLTGSELYVRARILSSKPMKNGVLQNEKEQAWTQPLIP